MYLLRLKAIKIMVSARGAIAPTVFIRFGLVANCRPGAIHTGRKTVIPNPVTKTQVFGGVPDVIKAALV